MRTDETRQIYLPYSPSTGKHRIRQEKGVCKDNGKCAQFSLHIPVATGRGIAAGIASVRGCRMSSRKLDGTPSAATAEDWFPSRSKLAPKSS